MFSTQVVLLQLLWLALSSATHYDGGVVSFKTKKIGPSTFEVVLRNRATFRGCRYQHGSCRHGGCGHISKIRRGVIDSSPNAPTYGTWCQTEAVVTRTLTTDRPFKTREYSCCWIRLNTPNIYPWWSVLTKVDLGTRSDTNAPNNSPATAIVPFLRVPQNCPRTYRPLLKDPDGDIVRCRYGNRNAEECHDCKRHNGFQLNEATCTLQYLGNAFQGVRGFELVVEDFPLHNVVLTYADGSTSYRRGSNVRGKRWAPTTPWWWTTAAPTTAAPTTAAPTTAAPTTAAPTTPRWWWWTTAAPTTTAPTAAPRTAWWWWTTAAPTTAAPRTAWRWWWTTAAPTTTTPTAAPRTAWWWWTTAAPTTATPRTAWWWWTTAAPTTAAPTTAAPTTAAPTTAAPTTAAPTQPLSVLPLQWVFRVDPPAPSCTEGLYLPKFVYPTPRHGDIIAAEAGREVEIRVKAQAQYSTVDNIIMSGPLNITKHRTTGDEFVIRWTPTSEEFGHHFPICFVVEFKRGSAIYQTEMRCVLVNVTTGLVKSVVTCTEEAMIVEVEKATLPPVRYDHLRLLSESSNLICSLQSHSNNTHVVAIVPLNRCGTQIEEDGDNLNFKNEITTEDDLSAVITRKHEVEIKFYCCYAKKGNVTATFSAHRGVTEVFDKGFGKFTYSFEFFPNTAYGNRMDPALYPLEYDVGERIYSQIEATTTVNNTELFVLSCRASPYDNENYSPTYTLIENGCVMDPTIQVHPAAHKREYRFSFEAFKFLAIQNHDQVFISCMVLMCEAGNPNTRCSRGCQRNGSQRWKREAVIESGTHYVSQGPLRRKRSAEAAGSSGLNLNLNLVFITGCVLVVVGMICGVIFYKTKKSTVKYQPLSTDEI